VCVFSGKIHFNFALLIWIMMVGVNNFWFNPIPFLIGSVFPDCDHKRAPMGRFLPLWLLFPHRGFTHTLFGLVLFSSLLALYYWKWGIIFACGYFLHLAMDSGTPMGIKWIRGHKKRAYR
jgi:membrane-bound metal-dependent hydrolase YbcI (DUF457 family)